MEEKGVIKIKEPMKGVENITEVTYDHPLVIEFSYDKVRLKKKKIKFFFNLNKKKLKFLKLNLIKFNFYQFYVKPLYYY